MSDDQLRPAANSRDRSPDELYSLSIEEVLQIFEEAGLPRTARAIQRYCARGKLDSHKVETPTGEKYLITPQSVERLIKYIKEVSRPDATSRDLTRHDATGRASENKQELESRPPATSTEQPRQVATSDDKYVSLLERENEFLRNEISVKNTQISELTERARENNHLVAGLQNLLRPVLNRLGQGTEHPTDDTTLDSPQK